jgi:hypothetical protein
MSSVSALILADPRCFAPSSDNPYCELARQWIDQPSASQRGAISPELCERYRVALEAARDGEIADSLQAATSPAVYRCLWGSLVRALDGSWRENRVPVARVFAIPLLIVTGGKGDLTVSGVLPDIGGVQRVLEQNGALGPTRNFGLSNALCELETLTRMPLSRIYSIGHDSIRPDSIRPGSIRPGSIAVVAGATTTNIATLDLPPSDLILTGTDESVHLRFLAGAAVTAADAPSFLETGADIGAWGMPLTRELSGQLNVDGLSILPIARPPQDWLSAQISGWRSREELSFQAFVSRVLRRFRAEVGEPEAMIAALDSGTIALRFTSPFIENRIEVHRWNPHALDDVSEIAQGMLDMLAECRVDVEVVPTVVSEQVFAVNAAAGGAH